MLLGRSAGLTEEKLGHIGDQPLPQHVYAADERVVITYARASTELRPIDDAMYADLGTHFSLMQVIELCVVVGIANLVNRFHATFLTDLDASTRDMLQDGCQLPFPSPGLGASDG